MQRAFVEPAQLTSFVRAAFGPARRLGTAVRLRGGSKKGVYRLTLDDGSTTVLYVWGAAENYWPTPQQNVDDNWADPFSDASGADLFTASHSRLDALGIRTPRVYLVDQSRTRYPADLALVEDVGGVTLETLLLRDPQKARQTLTGLGAALNVMHQHRGRHVGKLAVVDNRNPPPSRPAEQVVLDRALGHLAEAAARVERIADVHGRLADVTRELAAAVAPRERYGLVHGELGPDHVLVDDRGQPVIIDIEGLMFFDVEWEHAFLQMRFGTHYQQLRRGDLDEPRLRLYRLALHLSLIAGPLRLLDGDYPEREPMMEIVESHTGKALTFLR